MIRIKAFCVLRDFKLDMDEDAYKVGLWTFVKPEKEYNPIFDEAFEKRYGSSVKSYFLNRTYVVTHLDVEDSEEREASDMIVANATAEIGSLMNALWYIKDTSAALQNVYVLGQEAVICNLNAGNTKADASTEQIVYTKEDIEYALDFRSKTQPFFTTPINNPDRHKTLPDTITISTPAFHWMKQSEINRIERCLNFLLNARENPYLPLKIALYMSTLETLFSSDTGELTHKVSTRTSQYVGGDLADRVANAKIIKDAYGIRSKFFHGQAQDNKFGDINKIGLLSIEVDNIIRKVLKKVIFQDGQTFLNDKKHKELLDVLTFPDFRKIYTLKEQIEKHYSEITPIPSVSYFGAKQTLDVKIDDKQMNFIGLEATGRWENALNMKDQYNVTTDEAIVWMLKDYEKPEMV